MPGQWNQAEFFSADQHCVRGRKKYVGVNVGTLDQSCEVLSKKTTCCIWTAKITAMS